MDKKAIIIGAGPAGLTAAYELLTRTDIIPVILEKSGEIGGISRTINYKGNRMDMGPHRFFSKSDRVMDWWLKIMPLEENNSTTTTISYQNKTREVNHTTHEPADNDKVMLVIRRLTRIYFLRKFFAYPIQLSLDTLRGLGLWRTIKIVVSFMWVKLFPRKPEKSLEDFIINKFGRQLYLLFFKDYTEKVWGVPCSEISAEWGAQRIKGVSLGKAISQAAKSLRKSRRSDINQKETETSLIEQFLYPKKGPGALWEEVARQVKEMGGKIYLHQEVAKIHHENGQITSVNTINSQTGQAGAWEGDYFFSTMPVQELIAGMGREVPEKVQEVAKGLQYRDFINVGLLLNKMTQQLKDNWIYIQERDVKVGRLMIYNNWGDGMIQDPTKTWIGMEYFCNKTDALWDQSDGYIQNLAIEELERLGLAKSEDVLDATVRKMEKTYPAYFGTYNEFDHIRNYTDQFENLFLIGRNGMHKYNNADHSMLCAIVAVDNICKGETAKTNLWSINTEQEYHEKKQAAAILAGPANETKHGDVMPFHDYVFKRNKVALWIIVLVLLLQFTMFKFLYPFANFMFDSQVYIDSAAKNLDISIWPVGYSKFLRIISVFSHSDNFVVWLQYSLLMGAILYFYFTIIFLFKPNRFIRWAILIFICINPMLLSISNYVLSDALFTGLSLVWFTNLIWIILSPNSRIIITTILLSIILFTIRYNALYFPFLSISIILASKCNLKTKLLATFIGLSITGGFIYHIKDEYKQLTGKEQLSAFGGWQMASNALIMYRNLNSDDNGIELPNKFRALHALTHKVLDSIKLTNVRPDSIPQLYFIWMESSPLRQYMSKYSEDTNATFFKRWASLGPIYGQYGTYLIKKHPFPFAKYYLWQNIKWFMQPPVEMLSNYNLGRDTVPKLIKEWFRLKSNKLTFYAKEVPLINVMAPSLSIIINFAFPISVIGLLIFRGFNRMIPNAKKTFNLAMIIWILNFLFSILAAPIMLRYQLFNLIISLTFACLLLELLYNLDSKGALANNCETGTGQNKIIAVN